MTIQKKPVPLVYQIGTVMKNRSKIAISEIKELQAELQARIEALASEYSASGHSTAAHFIRENAKSVTNVLADFSGKLDYSHKAFN